MKELVEKAAIFIVVGTILAGLLGFVKNIPNSAELIQDGFAFFIILAVLGFIFAKD